MPQDPGRCPVARVLAVEVHGNFRQHRTGALYLECQLRQKSQLDSIPTIGQRMVAALKGIIILVLGSRREAPTKAEDSAQAARLLLDPSGVAATDSDYDDDGAPATKKPRKKQAVEPRSLPGRSKRVKNPGKPDMPRSQRSHEEVEAEKASKAQATADAAQQYNDAIALIAAHESQQKAVAAQEEANAVLSLEDLDPDDCIQ
ncbi:hypothetical protein B0H14DRAFT_2652933 [Mycena olivaceomarginata]|nr:hypothetical protein B0H14DRAFT_2652933 [Mycena olivaceomarginata]